MLLIDGNHLAARFWHKLQDLSTDDGRRSGVVAGVLIGVGHAAAETGHLANLITVVWDGGRAKWRTDLYPDYKKRKPLTDQEKVERDSFYEQLVAVRIGLGYLGVRQVKVDGAEADDLISIIAHQEYAKQGVRQTIYSGDKDFQQLILRANILTPDKGWLNEKDILDAWKIPSIDHLVRLRAMVGDSSDNIVGVPGIGPKRAADVIEAECGIVDLLPPAKRKWVDVANNNKDVIDRNIRLMRLPRTWGESGYDPFVEEQVNDAMAKKCNKDYEGLSEWAQEWQLNETLNRCTI